MFSQESKWITQRMWGIQTAHLNCSCLKTFMKVHSMFFDLVVLSDIHFKSELLKYFREKLCTRKYVMRTWKFKKITPISFTGSTKMHFVCLFVYSCCFSPTIPQTVFKAFFTLLYLVTSLLSYHSIFCLIFSALLC